MRICSVEVKSFILHFLKSLDITYVRHRNIEENMIEKKVKHKPRKIFMLFISLSKKKHDVS